MDSHNTESIVPNKSSEDSFLSNTTLQAMTECDNSSNGGCSTKFWNYLYMLRQSGTLCDVQLCVKEEHGPISFPVHKVILAASSQYFNKCLHSNDFLDVYNFDGITIDQLQAVIDYIYRQISWKELVKDPIGGVVAQTLELVCHDKDEASQGNRAIPMRKVAPSNSRVYINADEIKEVIKDTKLILPNKPKGRKVVTQYVRYQDAPSNLKEKTGMSTEECENTKQKNDPELLGDLEQSILGNKNTKHTPEEMIIDENQPRVSHNLATSSHSVKKIVPLDVAGQMKELVSLDISYTSLPKPDGDLPHQDCETPLKRIKLEAVNQVEDDIGDSDENLQADVESNASHNITNQDLIHKGIKIEKDDISSEPIKARRSGRIKRDGLPNYATFHRSGKHTDLSQGRVTSEEPQPEKVNDSSTETTLNQEVVTDRIAAETAGLKKFVVVKLVDCKNQSSGKGAVFKEVSESKLHGDSSPIKLLAPSKVGKFYAVNNKKEKTVDCLIEGNEIKKQLPSDVSFTKAVPKSISVVNNANVEEKSMLLNKTNVTAFSSNSATNKDTAKAIVSSVPKVRDSIAMISTDKTVQTQMPNTPVIKLVPTLLQGGSTMSNDDKSIMSSIGPLHIEIKVKAINSDLLKSNERQHIITDVGKAVYSTVQTTDSNGNKQGLISPERNITDQADAEVNKIKDERGNLKEVVNQTMESKEDHQLVEQSEDNYDLFTVQMEDHNHDEDDGQKASFKETKAKVPYKKIRLRPREIVSGKVKCRHCEYKAEDILDVQIHEKKVHSVRHNIKQFYKCEECEQSFDLKKTYYTHLAKVHHLRPYECKYCDVKYESKEGLRHHCDMNHYTHKPYHMCELCGKVFKIKQQFNNHMNWTHKEEPDIPCKLCDRKFKQLSTLTRHLKTFHCDDRNFQCDLCLKEFKTNSDKEKHRRRHFGPNPNKRVDKICQNANAPSQEYPCSFCGKVFQNPAHKKAHENIQHHDKQDGVSYLCILCNKTFAARHYLNMHITNAHKPKPIECQDCGHRFNYKYELRKHQPKCKGFPPTPKPYRCIYCNSRFTIKGNLTKHNQLKRCKGLKFPNDSQGSTVSSADFVVVIQPDEHGSEVSGRVEIPIDQLHELGIETTELEENQYQFTETIVDHTDSTQEPGISQHDVMASHQGETIVMDTASSNLIDENTQQIESEFTMGDRAALVIADADILNQEQNTITHFSVVQKPEPDTTEITDNRLIHESYEEHGDQQVSYIVTDPEQVKGFEGNVADVSSDQTELVVYEVDNLDGGHVYISTEGQIVQLDTNGSNDN